MKILMISTPHPFDAIKDPAEFISEGFINKGHDVTQITVSKNLNLDHYLHTLSKNQFDLVFTLDCKALFLRKYIKRSYEYIRSPLAIFLLDDPSYHFDTINHLAKKTNSKIYLLAPELNQIDIINKYIDNKNISNIKAVFFPWAAPVHHKISPEDKSIDAIAFCTLDQEIKTGLSVENYLNELRSVSERKRASEILNQSIYNNVNRPVLKLYKDIYNTEYDISRSVEVTNYTTIDSLVKKLRRLKFAQNLLKLAEETSLTVNVCGTGWDQLEKVPSNFKILGPKKYSEQFKLFSKSKIVFNLDPNWTHGSHDRIFNAYASGCKIITNENYYLTEKLKSEAQITTFKSMEYIDLFNCVSSASKIKESLIPNRHEHDWSARVSDFLNAMN